MYNCRSEETELNVIKKRKINKKKFNEKKFNEKLSMRLYNFGGNPSVLEVVCEMAGF